MLIEYKGEKKRLKSCDCYSIERKEEKTNFVSSRESINRYVLNIIDSFKNKNDQTSWYCSKERENKIEYDENVRD